MKQVLKIILSLFLLALIPLEAISQQDQMFKQKKERKRMWRKSKRRGATWKKSTEPSNPYFERKGKNKESTIEAKGNKKEERRQKRAFKKELRKIRKKKGIKEPPSK